MNRILSFIFIYLCYSVVSVAQMDTSSTNQLLELDLSQLVTTPSKVKFTQQESPGIVTLITEKDIKVSGANDLIDVLKLVPGISFHTDVQGVVGIGMRGIWGHEGKVLIMIDGQEMNELLYGNIAFGNHFDVSQIKKIEVVRGPGSSVYGGFAELGVINIITKEANDLNGVEVNSSLGSFQNAYAHRNVSVKAGKAFTNGKISLLGFVGQAQRSNQIYTSVYGTQTNLANNFSTNPSNLNFGFNYKNLTAKLILDSYSMKSRITYDTIEHNPLPTKFKSLNAEINYKIQLNSKVTITPKFQYINQKPWENIVSNSITNINLRAQKVLANIEGDYNPTRKVNLLFGVERFVQLAQNYEKAESPVFTADSSDKFKNFTTSIYLQGTVKHKIANLTIGGRYLHNDIFGAAFSPRVALTRTFNDLHIKFLYSEAFKTPTIMNIAWNPNIKPENTQVFEVETGYKLNSYIDFSVNAFSVLINHPIVYEYVNNKDFFRNHSQTGSIGLEGNINWHSEKVKLNFNYAYYSSNGRNKVDNYALLQNTNSVLGFANHTANLNATYNFTEQFSVNNIFSYVGSRYAYQFGSYNQVDDSFNPLKIDPTLQWNIFVNASDLFTQNFDLGFGINNILNQQIYFVQPYNSLNAPLPVYNRMFVLKIAYKI